MKFALLALALFSPLAQAESDSGSAYQRRRENERQQQERVLEAARRAQQERLQQMSREAAARHRQSQGRKTQPAQPKPPRECVTVPKPVDYTYCGQSFWYKAEALQFCPPAMALKAYHEGTPFYYCDCN